MPNSNTSVRRVSCNELQRNGAKAIDIVSILTGYTLYRYYR